MEKSWNGYITALANQTNPASNIDMGAQFPTSGGPASGFLEFCPRNKETQKKYDAMSPDWKGIEASNSAINLYRAEFMPIQNGLNTTK